ncbi:cupin domain-containing protein [Sphingomonas sp. SUN019]|uniref:cupin domain-containing protein n=1 Tax=Sphingomonas sp. SUN019 TaxID=2937788 RepID=UPI0021640C2B|nr:cupin domain-containing protein [Sphingomonas sp. SUN019]UVO49325.1 cupin domain-containing protein [Sphingomonas sp. SUN019]
MTDAAAVIARLQLQPHPEGGHYRETVRLPPVAAGGRSPMTAILYLLAAGEVSHWHRVDAAELWLWHEGAALSLSIADDAATATHRLNAESPQVLVPAHVWQSARTEEPWALVSCVVTPGFDFAGFELAPPGWKP